VVVTSRQTVTSDCRGRPTPVSCARPGLWPPTWPRPPPVGCVCRCRHKPPAFTHLSLQRLDTTTPTLQPLSATNAQAARALGSPGRAAAALLELASAKQAAKLSAPEVPRTGSPQKSALNSAARDGVKRWLDAAPTGEVSVVRLSKEDARAAAAKVADAISAQLAAAEEAALHARQRTESEASKHAAELEGAVFPPLCR